MANVLSSRHLRGCSEPAPQGSSEKTPSCISSCLLHTPLGERVAEHTGLKYGKVKDTILYVVYGVFMGRSYRLARTYLISYTSPSVTGW